MPRPSLAGQEIHFQGGADMLLGSYHRDGLDWDLLGGVGESQHSLEAGTPIHFVW